MSNSKSPQLTFFSLVAAACFALPTLASADLINITINPATGLPSNDIDFGLLGNNSPTTNFSFLGSEISLYNSYAGTSLSAPVFDGFANYENLSGSQAVSLTGFDYAVVHYGKGPGGAGKGGGVVFYYLNGMTGDFTFAPNGSGPNGFGGISSIRLFGDGSTAVPEGGTAAMLLGIALAAMGVLRRRIAA